MKKLIILSIVCLSTVSAMDIPADQSDSDEAVYTDIVRRPTMFEKTYMEDAEECRKALEKAGTVTDEEEKIQLLKFAFCGPDYVNISCYGKNLVERPFAKFVEENIRIFCLLSPTKIGSDKLRNKFCKKHGIDFDFIRNNGVLQEAAMSIGRCFWLRSSETINKYKEAIFWFLAAQNSYNSSYCDEEIGRILRDMDRN